MPKSNRTISPILAVIASIVVPGLGYFLMGQRSRALLTGGGVIALFVLGILFAGVRVISIPGYQDGYAKYIELHRGGVRRTTTSPATEIRPSGTSDMQGRPQYIVTRQTATGVTEEITADPPIARRWVLLVAPISVLFDNLWFLGQVLMGPLVAVVGYLSNHAAQMGVERAYGRLWDVGSLYTAVAGMLNLLLIVDAGSRAARQQKEPS